MTMHDRIVKELTERLAKSNFKEITIEMKNTGEKITIITCGFNISSFDEIDYFLVNCSLPWVGGNNINSVATFIENYDTRIKENKNEKKKLRAYYNKHKNDANNDWFDWYSDWYKDVYGHRPR